MPAARRCSECDKPLIGKGPQAKTCCAAHRAARSRRLKRVAKERGEANALPPEQKELQERVTAERNDALKKVIEEEVRPVVRESITEDTLKAIRDMVGLTGAAIKVLTEDLASEDATIRQRAYTLLLKYTVGHNAIVPPVEQDRTQPINVNFALPRPPQAEGHDLPPQDEPETVDGVAEELKTCDTCGREAAVDQFAANSTRCVDCYAKQRARVDELLNAGG